MSEARFVTTRTPAPDRAAAGGPRRLGLAPLVIATAQLMVVLDATIVNVALPHMQRALGFSGSELERVVNAYALAFGGLLLLARRAGDLLGRRQQAGGSGLAVLGTVAWTMVANSMHAHAARTAAATSQSAHQGGQLAATAHQHALTTGFSRAFLVAAGIALLNLAITIAAIRVRRTDLTGAHHPVTTESAEQTPQIRSM